MCGKTLVCVQSEVPGHAGSILHTQWAMFLWEKGVSMGSDRSEDMFLQAPLLLPASKVTLSLAKPPTRCGFNEGCGAVAGVW